MRTRQELLDELLVERYDNRWWTADTTPTVAEADAALHRREAADRGRIRGVA